MIDLSSSASTVDSRCYCHCVISYQKIINTLHMRLWIMHVQWPRLLTISCSKICQNCFWDFQFSNG